MEQNLLSGILSLSLVLLNPSAATNSSTTSQLVKEDEMRVYVVKEGETISEIAQNEYGSRDFWTNIWNDNPWIEDPNLIEEEWRLLLREQIPTEVAAVKLERKTKPTATSQVEVQNTNSGAVVAATEQANLTQPTPTASQAQPVSAGTGPLNDAQINFLGSCESGMRAATNTGNGFYGAFQFTIGTWNAMGTGYERADQAPLDVQIGAVQKLLSRSSIYTQFPGCAAKMRASGLL
jgi:hypothetical protein